MQGFFTAQYMVLVRMWSVSVPRCAPRDFPGNFEPKQLGTGFVHCCIWRPKNLSRVSSLSEDAYLVLK
ncbi:hypothetical protein Y1Q_0008077 [Alligator mississippiensis]|uniref:Uncharacterized protein n=1 Tax=Alligator mississippiensis TaxID=8496 RepID=A0A151NFF5_ALLMI|nr:hypothetical protein Y1Q_0008077 [Alligator mississippiensis]